MANGVSGEISFTEPVESALCNFKTVPSKMLLGDVKRIYGDRPMWEFDNWVQV